MHIRRWLLPAIVGLVMQGSVAQATFVWLGEFIPSQLRVSSFEAKVATVPLTIDGVEYGGKIQGLVSVAPQVIDIESQKFPSLDDLKTHVQEAYCTAPTGEIEFNAGRHINTKLGSGQLSAAAVIRIEITYAKVSQSGRRRTPDLATSVTCQRG